MYIHMDYKEELLAAIDDYQHTHRINTRAEAIRQMLWETIDND